MKMITTQKTMEMYPSVPKALGITPTITVGSLATVAAATAGSFISPEVCATVFTLMGVLPSYWLLHNVATNKAQRIMLTVRVIAFRKLAKKAKNYHNIDILDALLDEVSEKEFIKGMFGSVSIPIHDIYQSPGKFDSNIFFVMNKGEMHLEECTEVPALFMWDRALEHAMTDDEKELMPTHFTDPDYCRVKTTRNAMLKEISETACNTQRHILKSRLNDTQAMENAKFACGCKDCTPTFLRCTSCDHHADKCSCLQSEKYGAIVSTQAISA